MEYQQCFKGVSTLQLFFKILDSLHRQKACISKVSIITNIYSEVLKNIKNGKRHYTSGLTNKKYNGFFSMCYMPKTMLIDSFICSF